MTTLDDIATIVAAVSATVAALSSARNQRHIGQVKDAVNGGQATVIQRTEQIAASLEASGVPLVGTPPTAPATPPTAEAPGAA